MTPLKRSIKCGQLESRPSDEIEEKSFKRNFRGRSFSEKERGRIFPQKMKIDGRSIRQIVALCRFGGEKATKNDQKTLKNWNDDGRRRCYDRVDMKLFILLDNRLNLSEFQ